MEEKEILLVIMCVLADDPSFNEKPQERGLVISIISLWQWRAQQAVNLLFLIQSSQAMFLLSTSTFVLVFRHHLLTFCHLSKFPQEVLWIYLVIKKDDFATKATI